MSGTSQDRGGTPRIKKSVTFSDNNMVGYFHTVGWMDEQGKTRRIGVGSVFHEVGIPSIPCPAPIGKDTSGLSAQSIPHSAPHSTPIRTDTEIPHGCANFSLPPADSPATTPSKALRGTTTTSPEQSLSPSSEHPFLPSWAQHVHSPHQVCDVHLGRVGSLPLHDGDRREDHRGPQRSRSSTSLDPSSSTTGWERRDLRQPPSVPGDTRIIVRAHQPLSKPTRGRSGFEQHEPSPGGHVAGDAHAGVPAHRVTDNGRLLPERKMLKTPGIGTNETAAPFEWRSTLFSSPSSGRPTSNHLAPPPTDPSRETPGAAAPAAKALQQSSISARQLAAQVRGWSTGGKRNREAAPVPRDRGPRSHKGAQT